MRCYICDAPTPTPKYNRDLAKWEPCDTCMEAISDVLNDYKDNAVWVEEGLPIDVVEQISPENNGLPDQ